MSLRRTLASLAALLSAALLPTAATAGTPSAELPSAQPIQAIATVGPLFHHGLDQSHSCTASVLLSPGHDLILTAAHCVAGTGAGLEFVPGYDRGTTPYGVWTVTQAYVDPSWLSDQDPQHDYAVLRLARQQLAGRTVGVQDVVGGGNVIALAPEPGRQLTIPAYQAGRNDRPLDCSVRVYHTAGYPSFDCAGYVGGTSGSPWLIATPSRTVSLVAGVIGGLHQGGCVDYTSYSSAFSLGSYRLWLRASVGAPSDVLPTPGSDGC